MERNPWLKLTETLSKQRKQSWGVDAELQFLCFRSPRSCASSPDLCVHLDLALPVLLLAVLEGFLVLLVVGGRKGGVWWLWMWVRWMDGNGMGDGCGWMVAVVVWCLLWTFSSCGGGVTWDRGEVKLPSLSCTWGVPSFFTFLPFWVSLTSKLLLSLSLIQTHFNYFLSTHGTLCRHTCALHHLKLKNLS